MAHIAYVDHSFHQKTLSTAFLPEILRRHGHVVDCFWDDSWKGGAAVPWKNVAAYDVVIMFQAQCPTGRWRFADLHPNVIFIPMLDQFGLWRTDLRGFAKFWRPFVGSKTLNFSSALHATALSFGVASHVSRYYQPMPTVEVAPPATGKHGFLWVRREDDVSWRTVRALIGQDKFDSFHLHLAHDPGTPEPIQPSQEELERHGITVSRWFEDKSDFYKVLDRANIFFTPRLGEGIGQSLLEALGRGQCVVAPDHGTMNEYIIHGLNGLLYDPSRIEPMDFSDHAQLGRMAKLSALRGREQWVAAEAKLVEYVLTPSATLYPRRKPVRRLVAGLRRALAKLY